MTALLDNPFLGCSPKDIYKSSFLLFVIDFWEAIPGTQNLKMNWHIEVICEELQKIAHRVHQGLPKEFDLLTNISPGTSKSSCFSILFPAWVWTWFPECRFICASHTDSLVHDLAYKSRAVILSDKYQEYFPHVRLRKDRSAVGDYANTLGGERKSCTVGGQSPMGRHCDVFLVDDPLDPQKALSEAELKNANHFMTGVVPTRVTDKKVSTIILVQQRIHDCDPAGEMLQEAKKENAVPCRHLCLPAADSELTTPEYKHYYHDYNEHAECMPEGVMDPVRLDKGVLKQQLAKLGPYAFSAQFDQNPVPLGGGVFKEIYFTTRKRAAPYNALRLWYVDTAVSESDASCETAMTLMAKDEDGSYFVERVIRGHWEPTDRDKQMKIACQYTARRYPNQQVAMWVEREPGGSGRTAFQYIAKHLSGFVVKPHDPRGKKEVRAAPFASQCAAGNVFLIEDGSWDCNDWVKVVCLFPVGKLKDIVDSASGAYSLLLNTQETRPILRVIKMGSGIKKGKMRVIVCSKEELGRIVDNEHNTILLSITNPFPVGASEVEPTGFEKLQDSVLLPFLDADPSEYQEKYTEELPQYERPAHDLLMTQDHGKRLWRSLLQKRDKILEQIVVADDGLADRRAVSVAYAICDILRLNRKDTIYFASDHQENSDNEVEDRVVDGKAPNEHVYRTTKNSRGMVIN